MIKLTKINLTFSSDKKYISLSREHNSVDRTMHYYMQGPGFEPRTPHLFTL